MSYIKLHMIFQRRFVSTFSVVHARKIAMKGPSITAVSNSEIVKTDRISKCAKRPDSHDSVLVMQPLMSSKSEPEPIQPQIDTKASENEWNFKRKMLSKRNLKNPFTNLGVHETLACDLKSKFNIDQPTHAQKLYINSILSGQDLMLKDQTGTGKTFGILIGLLAKRMKNPLQKQETKVLFIVPSNALALQIYHWTKQLIQDEYAVKCIVTMDSMSLQKDMLNSKPWMIVATPERLNQLHNQKAFSLDKVDTVVLDEVDRLLDVVNPRDHVKRKFAKKMHTKPTELLLTPVFQSRKRQLICNSASLTFLLRMKLLNELEWIQDSSCLHDMSGSELMSHNVIHHCVVLGDNGSFRDLSMDKNTETHVIEHENDLDLSINEISKLVSKFQVKRGLVFCHSSMSLAKIASLLIDAGLSAKSIWSSSMRGASTDTSFENDFDNFNNNQLLVIDEFTARGLHFDNCDVVFILGRPETSSSYQHMSGRTGRFGRNGRVITLLPSVRFESKMTFIVKSLNIKIEPLDLDSL